MNDRIVFANLSLEKEISFMRKRKREKEEAEYVTFVRILRMTDIPIYFFKSSKPIISNSFPLFSFFFLIENIKRMEGVTVN